ncbi:MAG: AMP-binding protein [Candidatus Dormibacteria bacterium]
MLTLATGDIVWTPSEEQVRKSRLWSLIQQAGVGSYPELLDWAAADIARFWDLAIRDLGLAFQRPYERVIDVSRGPEWATWWSGARMNLAHYALFTHATGAEGAREALVWEGEDGEVRRFSYAQLNEQVARCASGLSALGIGAGDAVGLYLPMIPEVVVASLACAWLGAIQVPLFSGYGAGAIVARLQDSDAKAIICADGFLRRGGHVAMKEVADEAADQCPTVEHVVVVERLSREVPRNARRDRRWADVIAAPPQPAPRESDPEDPFMLIYTSGTTGRPKGTVHVHGGFPVKAAQDLAHCFDLGARDTLFWLTDIGWMMGPWAIFGALTLGARLVIYEGTPDHPGPDRLWDLAARHGITHLGVSPTLVRGLMRHGEEPVRSHDLSRLRVLGSTGEPWNPDPWMWLFENAGRRRCPIINYSGGTEISGGILCGNLLTPLRPAAFAGPVPGMDADVYDADGRPVRGQVGELVIKQPWPGMTRGFWKDPERYLDTYWSRWPGTWVHGDWALVDDANLWYILGRSDDTIKVAGKRVGPAEVESVLVAHPSVQEAAAVGVPDELKGEALMAFVILRPGADATEELRAELIAMIVAAQGKALKPRDVRFVADLPRTRNGKILRRLVRAAHVGEELGDTSSLENSAALEAVRDSS